MLNERIIEELDRYLRGRERAFYALQLDAPWGAGKTHFVRSYLERACAPVEPPGHVSTERRYVVVSLFGTASVADIERQLVAQLFSGSERLLGSLAASTVGGASAYLRLGDGPMALTRLQGPRLLSQRLERVRDLGGMIVFDDVERTRMPLRDALGYINRFVEHEGFRTLIVTNEAALAHPDASDEDQRNLDDLRRFKEKLVGRTLRLEADPEAAYLAFVAGMNDEHARRLAQASREVAIRLFHSAKRSNLRSLRMGLEAFDRLVPLFDREWLSIEEAMREVLLGCLLVAIEHVGGARDEVLANPAQAIVSLALGRDRDGEADPVRVEGRRIVEAFGDYVDLGGAPIPFSTLLALVANGQLLPESVRRNMSESPYVVGDRQAPPWRILINVWDLDFETSRRAVERARRQFDQLEVRDPGELLHLAGIMLWRADEDDLSLSGGAAVETFISDYLSRLNDAGLALEPSSSSDRSSRLSAHGYIVTGADEAGERRNDLRRLADLIQRTMHEGLQRRFPDLRARLLRDLAAPDRDLAELGSSGDMRLALQLPIFEGWGVEEFADLLLRDGKFDHGALSWLTDQRYGAGRPIDALVAEADWLAALADELRARLSLIEPPFRNLWRRALDARVDPALASLRGED